jgi:anti-anti-sigma factor
VPEILVGATETARPNGLPKFRTYAMARGRVARVTVAGELDIATASQLERALGRLEVHHALVLLALRTLEFMDCRGVRVILAAARRRLRSPVVTTPPRPSMP